MNNIGKDSIDFGYMDTLASGNTPLHRLDPRAKLIVTLAFIVAVVSFNKYALLSLVPFFAYPIILISLGGLPAKYILKKVFLILPFAVLLGIFNPLVDKQIIFSIGSMGISGGWVSFISIILRFFLTVSAALCLIALTGFNAVCESLMSFGVPKPFVVQLLFFYRYIFVLTDEAERLVRARSFRAIKRGAMSVKTFAALVGNLLLRTLGRAERIYYAMRCRGFDGHIRMFRSLRISSREVIFISGWVFLFVYLRLFNLPLQLGRLITGN